MRRHGIILLTMTGWMWAMAPGAGVCAGAIPAAATLRAVTLSATPTGQQLVLSVEGDYTYRSVQAAPGTLCIDLAGAKLGAIPHAGVWSSPLVPGYKLVEYQDASGRPAVRLQLNTQQGLPFTVERDAAALRLKFGPAPSTGPAGALAAAPVPATPPAAAAAPASPVHPASGPLRVSDVAIARGKGGETWVDISTSRAAEYHVSKLASPLRLVLDVEGAENSTRLRSYAADSDVLRDVRVAQFRSEGPAVVRVVADLKGNPAFDVHATPGGLRIELRSQTESKPSVSASSSPSPSVRPAIPTSPPAVEVAAAPPAAPPSAVPQPTVAPRRPERVEPTPAGTPAVAETKEGAKPDVQSALPPVPSSPQVVAAPLPIPAEQTPEALRAEQAAHILTPVRDTVQQAAQEPPAASVSAPPEEKAKYTGEPISLNLKEVDLKDFFRLIHEISGLNIIVDPNVSGSVTLVLDAVPWDQALDIVLKNNHLGKTLEGNVLRIAKLETLTAEQEIVTKLATARLEAAPLVTVFQPLNYAKAVTVAALLRSWTGGGALTRRGTVLTDDRSNTLIISDVQTQIPIIQSIVAKVDKKAKQVMIEARVVLATADFTRQLQSALSGNTHNHSGSTLYGGETGSSGTVVIPTFTNTPPVGLPLATPSNPTPTPLSPTTPVQQVLPGTSTGFGSFVISNASAKYLINDIISASEERDQAKTISRPTIVTQNNVAGMVQQGTQVPVQTTINNTITVNYVDATLRMDVTPQITEDGNVFMQIKVQNASVGALLVAAAPNINTQQATTQVLVPDGGTVVFGGITVTTRSKNATYIPWLGSIPYIGHLFKSSNVQDNDLELLFFVSPKILTT